MSETDSAYDTARVEDLQTQEMPQTQQLPDAQDLLGSQTASPQEVCEEEEKDIAQCMFQYQPARTREGEADQLKTARFGLPYSRPAATGLQGTKKIIWEEGHKLEIEASDLRRRQESIRQELLCGAGFLTERHRNKLLGDKAEVEAELANIQDRIKFNDEQLQQLWDRELELEKQRQPSGGARLNATVGDFLVTSPTPVIDIVKNGDIIPYFTKSTMDDLNDPLILSMFHYRNPTKSECAYDPRLDANLFYYFFIS